MKRVLMALMLVAPQAALALDCNFVTECYEAEECYDTAYDLSLKPTDTYEKITVETIAGNFEATGHHFRGLSSFFGSTEGTLHLITISLNNDARYAVHTGGEDGVTMITYYGTCTNKWTR